MTAARNVSANPAALAVLTLVQHSPPVALSHSLPSLTADRHHPHSSGALGVCLLSTTHNPPLLPLRCSGVLCVNVCVCVCVCCDCALVVFFFLVLAGTTGTVPIDPISLFACLCWCWKTGRTLLGVPGEPTSSLCAPCLSQPCTRRTSTRTPTTRLVLCGWLVGWRVGLLAWS